MKPERDGVCACICSCEFKTNAAIVKAREVWTHHIQDKSPFEGEKAIALAIDEAVVGERAKRDRAVALLWRTMPMIAGGRIGQDVDEFLEGLNTTHSDLCPEGHTEWVDVESESDPIIGSTIRKAIRILKGSHTSE